jgi:hypothetical protein
VIIRSPAFHKNLNKTMNNFRMNNLKFLCHMHLLRVLVLFFTLFVVSCVSHDLNKPIACDKSSLQLSLFSKKSASDCSQNNGEIEVTVAGGERPHLFQLNHETVTQSESIFKNIPSGIHSITVVDKNGCSSTLSNIMVPAENFKFTADVQPDKECINHDGSITIEVQEGTAPFSFTLNDGQETANNSFTNLAAGDYSIVIKDAASCTAKLNITVQQANTNTSWTNNILPIIITNCAVNGCHDGKTRTDYRLYNNALKNAANIKLYTQDGRMPFDDLALSQSQIDLIACWVNEGAPEN